MSEVSSADGGGIDLPPIESYARAADAMRDTTKWLAALIPGAGLAVVVIDLVPKLAQVTGAHLAVPLLLTAAATAAAACIVWLAVGVFAVEVPGWGEAVRRVGQGANGPVGPEAASLAAQLDADGVLLLYGYDDSSTFFREWTGTQRAEPTVRTVRAGQLVVDYASFRSVRARFVQFARWGAAALIAGAVAIGGAEYAVAHSPMPATGAAVTTPVQIQLYPTTNRQAMLSRRLRCKSPTPLDGWAVGGRTDEPLVVIDTRTCSVVTLRWRRDWGPVVPVRSGNTRRERGP